MNKHFNERMKSLESSLHSMQDNAHQAFLDKLTDQELIALIDALKQGSSSLISIAQILEIPVNDLEEDWRKRGIQLQKTKIDI